MSNKPERQQIINLLYKVFELEKNKQDGQQSENKLLHQERMILLSTEYLSAGLGLADLPFNFSEQFIDYTLSINKLAMEHFNQNNNDKAIHFLLKAIDILMQKSIHKFVRPVQKYGEIKVLTFNNLACIYQKRKQYVLALKSVSFAVELEEKLVQDNDENAKTSIISTLFNKAAIQSCLNKHNKAQDSLNKALFYIDNHEKELNQNNNNYHFESQFQDNENEKENENENSKSNGNENNNNNNSNKDEKLQNLNKLKMMCFYNLGVEDEHLFHKDRAKLQYTKSKQIADQINDSTMKDRLKNILDSFK